MADAAEVEEKEEFGHPGWQPISTVVNLPGPFFENCLFLPSYSDFTSNIYVIKGDYLTVVDPGNDYTAFMELWGLGFTPQKIKKIVVTHGHPDHWLGAADLLRSYPEIVQSGGFEVILHGAASPRLKETITGLGCQVTEVSGGETLDLCGLPWDVVHTPGHTIDGICLYHAPTKTVFTGDMVLPLAMAEPDPKVGGSLDHYPFGIRALLKLDIENLLPGHGPVVAPGGKRVVEDTYEALLMKIIAAEGPVPWLQGAKALAQKGMLEEALFCCEKEMARNQENLTALELKAICLSDLGRNDEAVEAFDRILAQRSDHVFALAGKGCALSELGRYDESLPYFDQALTIKPSMTEALMHKGMALYLAGRYDEAMQIEAFRAQFVGRFRDELLKKTRPSPA
jgi:glyoxylase-like metal-dependent hydrolase (beta-lactamase superfamily II)